MAWPSCDARKDDLLAVGEAGGHQFIAGFDVDGVDAIRTDMAEILELGFLDQTVAGGEENVFAFFFKIFHGEHGAHALAGLQADQAAHVFALAGCAHVGDFVNLEPVHAAVVGKDQNVGVGGGDEEMLDEILVAGLHAHAALSAAALAAVGGDGGALHVTAVAYGDGHLLVDDQVFELNFGGFVFNDGAAFVAEQLFDFFEFFDDHAAKFLFGSENGFVFGNIVADLTQLFGDFVDGKFSEAMQLQFEDGVGLNSGERLIGVELGSASGDVDVNFLAAEIGDQVFAGVATVGAAANDHNYVVEMIERSEIAFEDVFAVFRFLQQIRSAAADDVHAMVNEMLDRLDQAHFLGLIVDHGQEDHAETFLHGGVLVELIEDDLGLGAAFQFNNDAHAVAIAFVANVGDVFDDLVVH